MYGNGTRSCENLLWPRRIARPDASLGELANLVYETDELEIPTTPSAGEIFRELLLALAQSQRIELEEADGMKPKTVASISAEVPRMLSSGVRL